MLGIKLVKRSEEAEVSKRVSGGKLAAKKNLERDPDFYKKIGAKGGKKTNPLKGFGSNPQLAREAGSRGGSISKRS